MQVLSSLHFKENLEVQCWCVHASRTNKAPKKKEQICGYSSCCITICTKRNKSSGGKKKKNTENGS